MNRLLSIFVLLTWGVWLGSLVGLFVVLQSLNHTFADDRALFGTAATGVVVAFEKVQLGLAAAALLFAFGWRLCPGATRVKTILFCLFAVSTVIAVTETTYIAPRIEKMRTENLTKTDEFKSLHGLSMMLYTASAGALVIAGSLLPTANRRAGCAGRSGVA